MLPSDQRLKSYDPVGGELDLRLIIEHELALFEGGSQVRYPGPVMGRRRVSPWAERTGRNPRS